jgi:Lar family restriction alleviation protein
MGGEAQASSWPRARPSGYCQAQGIFHVSELLPCPFCGSDEVFVSQAVQGSCWVVCENLHCGAIGPTQLTPAEALAAWNSRALVGVGNASGARPTDVSTCMAREAVLPVEMESRLVGDIAAFRASEIELLEAFDPARPCLGRARERITSDLILVQVSGKLQGGFAWAYARPRTTHQQMRH